MCSPPPTWLMKLLVSIVHGMQVWFKLGHKGLFSHLSLRVSVEFTPLSVILFPNFPPFFPLCLWADGGRMISSLCRFTFARQWTTPCVVATIQENSPNVRSTRTVAGCVQIRWFKWSSDKSNWSFGVKSSVRQRLKLVCSLSQSMASSKNMASDFKLLKWNTSECTNSCHVISVDWYLRDNRHQVLSCC